MLIKPKLKRNSKFVQKYFHYFILHFKNTRSTVTSSKFKVLEHLPLHRNFSRNVRKLLVRTLKITLVSSVVQTTTNKPSYRYTRVECSSNYN